MNDNFANDSATGNAIADKTAGNDLQVARTSPDQNHYNTLTLDMIRIRLFDSFFLPLAGAPYRVTIGDAVYEDTADADAWAEIHFQGLPEQCLLDWGEEEETGGYLYSSVIYLNFAPETPDLSLNRQLHNLGYSDPLALCQDCQWDDPACVPPRLEDWHSDPDTVEPKPKYTMQGPPDDSEHPDAQQDAAPPEDAQPEDAETSQPKDLGTVIVDAIKSVGKGIGYWILSASLFASMRNDRTGRNEIMPPQVATTAAAPKGKLIGHIYTIRGVIDGEQVVYTGSTVQSLKSRFGNHKWVELIKAPGTKIEAHEVFADLNVAASGRNTLGSAQNEACRAAEQVIIKRRRAEPGWKELNEVEAAEEANIVKWGDTHSVRIGARFSVKNVAGGVKIAGFAAFQLLDIFLMWRDAKASKYVMAPYLLEDADGVFTINEQSGGLFHSNKYFKNYKSGPKVGQRVEITSSEFSDFADEARALWGYLDWANDWIPGLLRTELPVIEAPDTSWA